MGTQTLTNYKYRLDGGVLNPKQKDIEKGKSKKEEEIDGNSNLNQL